MVGILGCCCGVNYGAQAVGLVARETGLLGMGDRRETGELKDHVDQVAQAMGIQGTLSLVPRRAGSSAIYRLSDAWFMSQFFSFGNTLLPCSKGVGFNTDEFLSGDALKFFLTRNVAELKTHHHLFGGLLFLIVGIASTVLLLPTYPIAGFFIGAAAGNVARHLFSFWNERNLEALTMKHTTPNMKRAALDTITRLQIVGGAGRMKRLFTLLTEWQRQEPSELRAQ